MTTTMTTSLCCGDGDFIFRRSTWRAAALRRMPRPSRNRPRGQHPTRSSGLLRLPPLTVRRGLHKSRCGGPLRPPPCVAQRAQQTRCIRRIAASIGLTVAEPAAKKPRAFASSVQELQELKALKDSGVIDDNEFNRLRKRSCPRSSDEPWMGWIGACGRSGAREIVGHSVYSRNLNQMHEQNT